MAATSITWWNCERISPFASNPAGQCTIVPLRVPPQCDAICFVHWYGVSIACAQPTAKWLYAVGVPNSSILETMNSVVSSPKAPFRTTSSLKHPVGVPSADAPLSPMM